MTLTSNLLELEYLLSDTRCESPHQANKVCTRKVTARVHHLQGCRPPANVCAAAARHGRALIAAGTDECLYCWHAGKDIPVRDCWRVVAI